ncbi:hypothetical protein Prudu_017978 [Prunus dulcis]|uniref:Uncharacterized protein n=1 Tax=Prunus dulcis TaxID=3755 RepID=A0A4Y1RPU0_PRUDU|nr:hypothetical protein Prudu_017978 [Prunus dulcis]
MTKGGVQIITYLVGLRARSSRLEMF